MFVPARYLLIALGVQSYAFKQGFFAIYSKVTLKKKQILPSGRMSISLSACGPVVMHHGPSCPVDVLGDIIHLFIFFPLSVQLCIYTNPLEPLLPVKEKATGLFTYCRRN